MLTIKELEAKIEDIFAMISDLSFRTITEYFVILSDVLRAEV
jgi:hypothetical protein